MNRNQLTGFLVCSLNFCQRPRSVISCAQDLIAASRISAAAMVSFANCIFTWNILSGLRHLYERNGRSIWPFHERADHPRTTATPAKRMLAVVVARVQRSQEMDGNGTSWAY